MTSAEKSSSHLITTLINTNVNDLKKKNKLENGLICFLPSVTVDKKFVPTTSTYQEKSGKTADLPQSKDNKVYLPEHLKP